MLQELRISTLIAMGTEWRSSVRLSLPLLKSSDDFVFDNQMIAQAVMAGFRIGEISCVLRAQSATTK